MKSYTALTPANVTELIPDGSVVCMSGFVGIANPDYVLEAVENAFLTTGHPRDLTLVYCAGNGNRHGRGAERFAHEGMLKRVIGGHFGFAPALQKLINAGAVQGYNLPQGTLAQMIRDTAGGRPGTVTKVGLGTFVDPRLGGGKLNDRTTEDLVQVVRLLDQEWLLYKRLPITTTVLRATWADEHGNLSVEHEAAALGVLAEAQAAHNNGGRVIAQVQGIVRAGSLDPRLVRVPGFLVDAVVVAPPERSGQTFVDGYVPAYNGEVRVPLASLTPLPLTIRKVIARRAFFELQGDSVVNLGIGIPEGIAAVAEEEGAADALKLTVESGATGGLPASGERFGAALDPDALVDEAQQFDFYDGGGLDTTFIGLAQMDGQGNVNVSKFGPTIAGCGGAINITQQAKRVVFCGTFTTGGLRVAVEDGKLRITQEGRVVKLVDRVEQITFSGAYARRKHQPVLFVTERAVFELGDEGVVLTEIAPGIDPERDVLAHMGFRPVVARNLKTMDRRIFQAAPMRALARMA